MPRKAHPWYRKSRKMWFVNISGTQTPLGVTDPGDEAGALEAWRKLVEQVAALAPRVVAGSCPRGQGTTVTDAVAKFLEAKARKISAGSLRNYQFFLSTHFAARFGGRLLPTLTADEIEDWGEEARGDPPAVWSDTYRANCLAAVGCLLRWAGRPLDLNRPARRSRGGDVVLSDDQFERVLSAYDPRYGSGDLPQLLRVLRESGARPQEVASLTAEAVDWTNRCARLTAHKGTAKGLVRTLHFGAAAAEILEAQRAKHGSGHLFRTRKGNAYRGKAIVQEMRRLSARVGFRAIAYGQRHSFATRALCRGVPDTVVAALLGHTSTAMVHKNYGHVGEQSRVLKDALEKISRPPAG